MAKSQRALVERIWYGGGSLRSMRWAGEQGLNLLTGNIVTGETSDEFTAAQIALIKEYRSVIGADRPGDRPVRQRHRGNPDPVS